MDELKKLLSRINIFSALVNFFLSRAMLLEQSLKEKYSTVLRVGLLFASFLLLLGFYSLQRFENNIDIETESQIIIENIEIPETQQFETPPPLQGHLFLLNLKMMISQMILLLRRQI